MSAIQFFLPHPASDAELPDTVEAYWPWICRNRALGEGRYSWTLQTFLHLRRAGLECRFVRRFPSSGIVVSHRDFLPMILRPRAGVFLVCIKPDRKEHTWAHYYVVQNRSDPVFAHAADRASETPFWPQPSLIPRPDDRAVCERVAYFGRALNLAPELRAPEWPSALAALGFDWAAPPLEEWNDYSRIDVTVSVRGFGDFAEDDPILNPNSKPPSKLVNSWLAGVPAIVGRESSFRNVRRSPLDYLEVTTVDELKAELLRLRNEPALYRDMVAHGRERALEFSAEAVAHRWRVILESEIRPAHEAWAARGAMSRQMANVARTIRFLANPANLPRLSK
jgi:hypothetical protein